MAGNKFWIGMVITAILLTCVPSASAYTLGVFGNSNEDDTIDQKDVEYTASIVLGLDDQTQLADAKYDHKIDILDVTQIELIIIGMEKELTIIDSADRIVTVQMPVENIIPIDYRTTEALLAMGARDMIVGVDQTFHNSMPELGLSELPVVSVHAQSINYEMILALKSDLVLLPTWQAHEADDVADHLPNVEVIVIGCTERRVMNSDLTTIGMILGKGEEAGELIDWIAGYDEIVEERTKDLDTGDIPTFYYEAMAEWGQWLAIPPERGVGQVAEGCGGSNIAAGLSTEWVEVDQEWVMEQNPDVMFADLMGGVDSGTGKTEADMEELLSKVLAERPGFEYVNAVKNNKVYLIDRDVVTGPGWVVGHIYFAKLLHPELFGDIDPEEIHKEYLKVFHDLELEGTWIYPVLEVT